LSAERLEQLSQAILDQPSNAIARGLLGFVRHQGRWERPEVVGESLRNDPAQQALIREYLDRRALTAHTPEDQMKLADWCAKNRLKDQAQAHYNAVIRLDPSRDAAWRHLGYRKQGMRWVKPEELAAEKQEAVRQKQADRRWSPKMEKLRNDMQSKDAARRARAEQVLAEVTDPRAVPSIWAVFVPGGVRHQMAAIQMFGQIDGPSASNALAALAIFNPWPEVRARAIEALMRRDPRDVVGRLIAMVHKPFKYEARPVQGPGSPGELYVEGERFNFQRLYENRTFGRLLASGMGRLYSPDVPFDPFSIQNLMMATGAWAANLVTVTPHGLAPGAAAPIDPTAAAQAARAMSADPQNAPAILNQLTSDPSNRVIPPGYSIALTNPAYSIPVHLQKAPAPLGQFTPAELQGMQAFVRMVQAQQNNPLSPLGLGIQLGKLENNPAHKQAAAAMELMLPAQQMAAKRDVELGMELERIRQSNLNLQQRLAMDVEFIEWTNQNMRQTNARVLPVLKAITGLDLDDEPEKWWRWWMDQLGHSQGVSRPDMKPTYRERIVDATGTIGAGFSTMPEGAPPYTGGVATPVASAPVRACFAIGTMVHTVDGPRPIESLQAGDRVLCQDTTRGSLEFRPVLAVHRNMPASTLRIAAGGESIEATGLQRFWRTDKGWTMARELKPGDRLRVIGGVVPVASIERARTQPVYNIAVAEDEDLFVASKGLLVHDCRFVPAVPEPFDLQAELTPTAAPARR
jgi:hypothetical protein